MKITYFHWILIFSTAIFMNSCGKKMTETAPIQKDVTDFIFASGTLEPDQKYNLTAQSDGYLSSLKLKEGDILQQGAVIGYIDNKTNVTNAQNASEQLQISESFTTDASPALQQIAANITVAKQKLEQDRIQAERYRHLLESNSVSKLENENAQLAYQNAQANVLVLEKQYANTKRMAEQQFITQRNAASVNSIAKGYNEIRVLSAGKVYKKLKEVGDFVRKGDVIATIANSQFIYAKLNVDESSIQNVAVGQPCYVRLNVNRDKVLQAEIYEIMPTFDELSQSFICKARFKDALPFSISGTQLEANIAKDTIKNALLIPRNFLLENNKVQVKNEKEKRTIKTGFVSSDWVEIKEGLTTKDILIAEEKTK